MGFLNFLKPKKGLKGAELLAAAPQSTQLPPLPTDSELYSELPNLPEAPETSGLSEIELPEPLKGLEGFDVTGTGEEKRFGEEDEAGENPNRAKHDWAQSQIERSSIAHSAVGGIAPKGDLGEAEASKETATPQPLLPNWPELGKPFGKQFEEKLPELPEMPELKFEEEPQAETELQNIPSEVPELKPFEPEQKGESEFSEGLISHGGSHYLSSTEFRMVTDGFDSIIKTQKKHHNLTEIRKEENQHYEQINVLFEDIQRRLMLIDKTLFE